MNKDTKLIQDIKISQTFLKKVLSSSDVNTLNIVSLQVNEMKVGEIKIERGEKEKEEPTEMMIEDMIMCILEALPSPKDAALKALVTRVMTRRFTIREAAKFLGVTPRCLTHRSRKYGVRKKDLIKIDQTE